MELISSVDSWRFEQRRRDAEVHSLRLVREIPLALAAPLFSSPPSHPFQSREDFRTLLRERVGGDEYDSSQTSSPRLEKENQLDATKRHNIALANRLAKALSHQAQVPLVGKIDKRKDVSGVAKRFDRMTRALEPYGKKAYQMKHKEEIEELQAKLEGYRIDRKGEDTVFYDLIANRERNVLLEEVMREMLEEEADDAYEEAEEAARKKQLPPEQLKFVLDALHGGPESDVLVQKFNVDITRRHLQCMLPLQWLNDEVINFWFQLLNDRDEALVKSGALSKRSHFFNSFFYTKVSEGGYNFINVRRWTRKIDLFAMDKIFVPVNVSNTHWCLAVIYMTEKRIQYFDSMNGPGTRCLDVLLKYLHDEMQHKKSQPFDAEGWKLVPTAPGTPQQENGSDCGVFTCIFADYLSRNEPLSFSQKDMEFHRHRMVLRVVQGDLPLEEEL